ncbi:MAG TPA: methyltransferase domain-containing protein [Candidatus Dormibacteraeota bacterium]|nr:methyltransferase domain-containing protein [Candidatus Dormibacteraeota bacterium]
MAARLAKSGVIRSDAWRRAVERVPRHVLVPRFYERQNGRFELIDGANEEQRERWLHAVYDPFESLVTEYDPVTMYPTSSATMPYIVLSLLEALDAEPGHRVLDVGTGSGYSAALLCERVGFENVTTIDIGVEVVQLARERLRQAGYAPTVVCDDAYHGHAPNAPFDRIVSTVGLDHVPNSWLTQTRPGGVIVATLPETTVRLVRRADGSAEGRFIAGFQFMWLRGHAPAHEPDQVLERLVGAGGETRSTDVDLEALLLGRELPAFWSLGKLLVMPRDVVLALDGTRKAYVDARDRSWMVLDPERGTVTQGGPRRIWDALERLYDKLEALGRPASQRFGLTVHSDGSHVVWLDSPDSEHRWTL